MRVAAGADGAAAVATTDGDGRAIVPIDLGLGLGIGLAPPAGHGELAPPLPWPRRRLVAALDGSATPLEIRLPALPLARLTITAIDAAGAAIPGARVGLAATLGDGQSVRASWSPPTPAARRR